MDEQHKEQVYQLANIGHWQLDVVNNQLYWSDQLKRLHEVPMDYDPELEKSLAFYLEGEHRERVRKAVEEAIEEGTSFFLESQIITAKGNTRWVKVIGESGIEDGRCVSVYGSTQDITAQREAEEQAREVHQKLQDMVEHSTIMFYRHDTNHKLTYVSPQSHQFLGCPPEEAKKRWTEFVTDHPKNKEGFKKVEKAIQTGQPQPTYELQLERADGEKIWVQVNESPVVKNGETVEIVGSLTNITDVKEKQQEFEEKEAQLRNIANNIDGMIHRYVMHPDGSDEFPFVSEGVKDLHELTPQQVIDSPDLLWSQIADDHIDRVKRSVQQSTEELRLWNQKWKIETPSGQHKWIHGRGTPQQLADGSVIWDTILVDITDQKELEQNFSRQVTLLNHILDSLSGLFYILAEDGTFVRVNKNVEELFGKSTEELQGTRALDFIASRKKEQTRQAIERVFGEGYAEQETILVDDEDQEHHYYMNGSYLELDGEGYLIGNGIDITGRVRAEKENRILLKEIHHRVKNNLAIISGILSMDMDEMPSDSSNRLSLERSVNRIQAIAKVHELLFQSSSFSQIKVKDYVSELVRTTMNTLQVGEKVDFQLNIEQIKMNLNEITPLGMLLNELLTNSLKYAFEDQQKGFITLDITKHNQSYSVKYRDNGRGFDQCKFEDSETMGFTITNALLQQLEADVDLDTSDGFTIDFTFPKQESGSHANL